MKSLTAMIGLIVAAALSSACRAQALEQQWFEKANAFYQQQNVDSAACYYEKILDGAVQDKDVYYNLGNAYFRLKNMGKAILMYEKAHALSPDDPDINANLRFVNASIVDKIPPAPQSFFEVVLGRLHNLLGLAAQLWLLLGLLLALSVLFAGLLYSSGNIRLWIIYGGACLSVLAALTGVSAGIKIYRSEKTNYAIVLVPALDAKNQPDGNKSLFTVHEGTKFRIRNQIDQWVLVSLPNGVSGWVELSALGKI
ncbi:MAG: tetratricopeptide repeat protein [Chitinivibrionales bacterium]|nr:tetratricopeptide repeat protein [Chitinivibrionales bacterium]